MAFAGKIVGAEGAALVSGFSRREAASIGVSMSARGVVEAAIAVRRAAQTPGLKTRSPAVFPLKKETRRLAGF